MPALDASVEAPAIVIVGSRESAEMTPNTKESVGAAQLRTTTNVRNTEDALRYFPSLFVRKRHIGDTQAPLATRTSGVGASARSLVYADGVLLSALIGNNNNFASPRWGMVSPEEISQVDVLYGPFSAQYPGNSIGAVVNITTRMPDRLEASATAATNVQTFDQYGTHGTYPAYQLSGTVGDRSGPLSWFLSADHVDSESQPLAYITVPRSSGPVTPGGFATLNRLGQPIDVIGAGGFEHQKQDNLKAKVALDLPGDVKLSWQTGLFLNNTNSHVDSYTGALTDASANQVYRFDERHWMHALKLEQNADAFYWSVVGSLYDYAKDEQRIPGSAAAIDSGRPGSIVRMNGTGWRTFDLHGFSKAVARHELHAGAHYDGFTLRSRRFNTSDWMNGARGALAQESLGHTRTLALWAEDHWAIAPSLMLTLGGRYEWWRAWGGRNFNAAPRLDLDQPSRTARGFSPKASIRWQPARRWSVTLSGGRALRFPTVSELYQATSVGSNIQSPDPNLKPEQATSAELAVERSFGGGKLRLSLFRESIRDALISQTGPLPGQTQLFTFVQNVDRVRTNGIEFVVEKRDLLPRFDLSGSVTLADPKIVSDPVLPAAEGKLIPQVPRRKATLVATWHPTDRLSLTGAARYSSRMFATIDNSDRVGHTYQGFEGYFVGDIRAVYRLSPHLDVAAGVENVTDNRYFLFHPFPGRTFTAEVNWRFRGS